MKTTIYKTMLLVLFGFVFIYAIHSILVALIYLYFHYGLSDRFLNIHFQYYLPAFTLAFTFVFSLLSVWLIVRKKEEIIDIEYLKLPWFLCIITLLIAIVLKPITYKVSGHKLMLLYEDLSKFEYMSKLNFDSIFKTINYSELGSLWFLLLLLFMSFFYLNKKAKS